MKIIKTFSLLALMLLVMGACENNRSNTETEGQVQENVNPDEVTNRWGEAWQNNQFDSLRNMIADDAVLLLNGREVPQDSIQDWLQFSASNMQDLESNSLKKNSQGNIVWDSGTFSHGFANDTAASYEGTYTFIWERTDGGQNDWKARVMHISADMGMDTINMQQQNQQQQVQ